MKRVLLISYYFPPVLDVGGLRALGFAQNLSAFGWEPYVLSVKNPDTSLCKVGSEKPPADIKTFYCRSWFHLNRMSWKANGVLRLVLKAFGVKLKDNIVHELFVLPDAYAGWVLPAYLAGLRLIKKHDIDVIYVSSKPFSSVLSGVMLKRVTKKPLVLDFRDPVSFPENLFSDNSAGKLRRQIVRKIECFALANAEHLMTTTRETLNRYKKLYPFLKGRSTTVYNGYFLPPDTSPIPRGFDTFTIVYIGNFYYGLVPCDTFFQALKQISDRHLIPSEKFRFLYVGALREKSNWLEEMRQKYDLGSVVETTGHVSKSEAQNILRQSALMLLRIVPPMISTKLFESLRDGVPILAVIESFEVEELINTYSANSYIVTSNCVKDVTVAIVSAYSRWSRGERKKAASMEYLAKFNKMALTAQFAAVLDGVCTNPMKAGAEAPELKDQKAGEG